MGNKICSSKTLITFENILNVSGVLFAIGKNSKGVGMIVRSENKGESWDVVLQSVLTTDVKCLAWDGKRLVAGGNGPLASLMYSPDFGRNWIGLSYTKSLATTVFGLKYTENGFIGYIQEDFKVLHSKDGIIWCLKDFSEPTLDSVGVLSNTPLDIV